MKEKNINITHDLALFQSENIDKAREERRLEEIEWSRNGWNHWNTKDLTDDEHEKSRNEEATMSERTELRILQYNVNKFRKNIVVSLL